MAVPRKSTDPNAKDPRTGETAAQAAGDQPEGTARPKVTDTDRLAGNLPEPAQTEGAIDSTATVPAIGEDQAAAFGAKPGNLVADPTIPMRTPDGDSPNESPVNALGPREIPGPFSNTELGTGAGKREAALRLDEDAEAARRAEREGREDR